MKKLIKILPVFLIFSFLALPLIVGAVEDVNTVRTAICRIVNNIKLILVTVGFAIAFILLIVGGIMYMTGGGDPEKGGKGRKMIVNALVGIAIVIAALFILSFAEALLSGQGINLFRNPCEATWVQPI